MKYILVLSAFFFVQSSSSLFADQNSPRPNVVFVLTDDQRSDALGCMGHPHLKTPHIDRLAKEGLLFKNHFCTNGNEECIMANAGSVEVVGDKMKKKHAKIKAICKVPGADAQCT